MRVHLSTMIAIASALFGIALLVLDLDPRSLAAHPLHAKPLTWR
jgi:hypothetical protein